MEMKSMELPKQKQEVMESPVSAEQSRYPYGLNIRLENDSLDKLDMDTLPSVGEEVMIMAKAKVESVSVYEGNDKAKSRSVSLQICSLGVEPVKKIDIEKSLYGKK